MTHCSVSIQACELQLTIGSHFLYGSFLQVSKFMNYNQQLVQCLPTSVLLGVQRTVNLQFLFGPRFTSGAIISTNCKTCGNGLELVIYLHLMHHILLYILK